MRATLVVVLSAIFATALCCMAIAGSLDSPGAPSAGSGMYTLQNLYDYLTSGTALTVQSSFQEPTTGPTAGTMKTTKQIGDAIKALLDQSDVDPDNVESGKRFFCTQPGSWGVKTGTLTDPSDVIFEDFTDADGYHNYVNMGNTTATFDTNKYVRESTSDTNTLDKSSTTVDSNVNIGSPVERTKVAGTFTTTDAIDVKLVELKLSIPSGGGGLVVCRLYGVDGSKFPTGSPLGTSATRDSAGFVAGSGTGNWEQFTFATPVSLSASTTYAVSYEWNTTGTQPVNNITTTDAGQVCSKLEGSVWMSVGSNISIGLKIYAFTAGSNPTRMVEIDLPVITGTVTHTQLILNDPDRETGDSITYDLLDSVSAKDTDLAVDTKNALFNPDGTKITGGKIKINLIPKNQAPTQGVPSVKSFTLIIWKE
ncbi:MAG: hypothetical protein NTZ78_08095 [Candidatus Aureabacteria bacterium]|nr:hypothetical protein [Candidatus Auribacterota bacterium]